MNEGFVRDDGDKVLIVAREESGKNEGLYISKETAKVLTAALVKSLYPSAKEKEMFLDQVYASMVSFGTESGN
jgi:hypothetical protein